MTRSSRAVALEALVAIEADRSYANLRLGPLLAASGLDERDRRFVTDLVYGSIRYRRALDHLADRFLSSDPPAEARNALRLGAYQLHYADVASHAAVSETVAVVPARYRGLVNAVLRKIATAPVEWPDDATRLSYPDWILQRLSDDLGDADALAMAEAMNQPPDIEVRADGYVQDRSSQWVVDEVDAAGSDLVVDLCAAPGGKATGLAATGARVIAVDQRPSRVRLMMRNVSRLGAGGVSGLVGDGRRPPLRPAEATRVLLDAPCSGLGVLGRRADARWRLDPAAVSRLAALQSELLAAAADLVAPGGRLVFSVCTVTRAETLDVAAGFGAADSRFEVEPPSSDRWRPWGSGGLVLPQDHGTDGMAVFRWRRRR